jgi:hypothetical protein
MFAPFTSDEVESIRSIVLIDQQDDDMLVSNCSSRPIAQTRSFIRRFKNLLLDSAVSIAEITKSANEQYVAIIAGVKVKRGNKQPRLSNATSVANLSSSLMKTVPFKFRIKYARTEATLDQPPVVPPTRSRSICEGLALPDRSPPVAPKLTHDDLAPKVGDLAAVFRQTESPAVFCRILGRKPIHGNDHFLVAFFRPDIRPCYVRSHQLVVFGRQVKARMPDQPGLVTIDALLDSWIRGSQSWIYALVGGPLNPLIVRALAYAIRMLFLSFAANYVVPREKLRLLLGLVGKLNPLKYNSSRIIDDKSRAKIEEILALLG